MFCNLEDVKNFKVTSEELIQKVKESLPNKCTSREMEIFEFDHNGKSFALCEVESDEIVSDGKYENGGNTYQLIEFNKRIVDYPCGESITNEYDLLIYVGFYRTGSFFTEWNYEYDFPVIKRIVTKPVPEQIIPAHDEIYIEKL